MIALIEMETNKTTAKNKKLPIKKNTCCELNTPTSQPPKKVSQNENFGRSTGLCFIHFVILPKHIAQWLFDKCLHLQLRGQLRHRTEFPITPLLVPIFAHILYIVFVNIYNLTYCVHLRQAHMQK